MQKLHGDPTTLWHNWPGHKTLPTLLQYGSDGTIKSYGMNGIYNWHCLTWIRGARNNKSREF